MKTKELLPPKVYYFTLKADEQTQRHKIDSIKDGYVKETVAACKTSFQVILQSTLVISTSVISNNRLSGRETLVRVLTQKSKIRLQNIIEKRRNCS